MVAKYQALLTDRIIEASCSIGVEIGVYEGQFSEYLLVHTKLDRLYSIDCWEKNIENTEPQRTYNDTIKRLSRFGSRSLIIKGYSVEAAKLFPAASVDFVYIDAVHHYETVTEDMEIWWDKLVKNGIFCGDDYDWPSVAKAVDNFVVTHNICKTHYEIIGKNDLQPQWLIHKNVN